MTTTNANDRLNSYEVAVLKDLVLADIKRLQESAPTPANVLTLEKRHALKDKLWENYMNRPIDLSAINYKSLLKRYIAHVINCESIDFLSDKGYGPDRIVFSQEEIAELRRLSGEGI